ncbi:hypothetical protein HOY80DRAFT_963113 [Tuber brumale]|nr:hypothetical protein HOY80DRAFT_963113 [Tuber brumale]
MNLKGWKGKESFCDPVEESQQLPIFFQEIHYGPLTNFLSPFGFFPLFPFFLLYCPVYHPVARRSNQDPLDICIYCRLEFPFVITVMIIFAFVYSRVRFRRLVTKLKK